MTPADYRAAPSGQGPLAGTWRDKPHRLVYDLCTEVETLRALLARVSATCVCLSAPVLP